MYCMLETFKEKKERSHDVSIIVISFRLPVFFHLEALKMTLYFVFRNFTRICSEKSSCIVSLIILSSLFSLEFFLVKCRISQIYPTMYHISFYHLLVFLSFLWYFLNFSSNSSLEFYLSHHIFYFKRSFLFFIIYFKYFCYINAIFSWISLSN